MTTPDDRDLVDVSEAATVLGVQPAQVDVLADQGLLTPVASEAGGPRFARAEVDALRLAGA